MSSVKENGFSNSNKVAVKPPKANQERPELGTTSTNGSSAPSNGRSMLEPSSFLKQVTELILESNLVGKEVKNDCSLVEFMKPKDLEEVLKLKVEKDPADHETLLEFCHKVIKYSIKTCHPMFYNQLYGGIDEYSLAGSWLTDALNTSQATYEISPVFTLLEREIIQYLGSKCGWERNSIDGIFAPGGSMANIFGMILARHSKFPSIKTDGLNSLNGQQLVTFVSEDAHYSFVKGSIWMGHGSSSVIKVSTDHNGCMNVSNLEECINRAISEGKIPFMVVATSGTTVLGAFDPIAEISKVASKYDIWLHVDAALGGTVLFSRKHKHLMHTVSTADSVAWNLHKLGGVPLQCSAFLTRHPTLLTEANSLKAEYLFQSDKYYDASYDSGDKSIQCGRKVDSLKLWLALVARGEEQMECLVDNVFNMVHYVTSLIQSKPNFRLILPKYQGNNVCFWYIPDSLKSDLSIAMNGSDGKSGLDVSSMSRADMEKLNKVCPLIKGEMMKESRIMVNYQPLSSKGLPNFFRLVLTCIPKSTREDMDLFLQEIERLGSKITL